MANALYGVVEPFKLTFVFLALLSFLVYTFYPWFRGRAKGISLVVGVVLLSVPIIFEATTALVYGMNDGERYKRRVEKLLNRNLRVYQARILPTPIYRFLKHSINHVFNTEIIDTQHRYEEITVEVGQTGNTGTATYEYRGWTYGNKSTPIRFICYGEADLIGKDFTVIYRDFDEGDSLGMDRDYMDLENRDGGFVSIGELPIDSLAFWVERTHHVVGGMGDEHEGFLLDFRTIEHPPRFFGLSAFCDCEFNNLVLWRIVQKDHFALERILRNYVFNPRYEFTNMKDADELVPEDSMVTIEGQQHIVKRWTIPASGQPEENVFLLDYHVKRK